MNTKFGELPLHLQKYWLNRSLTEFKGREVTCIAIDDVIDDPPLEDIDFESLRGTTDDTIDALRYCFEPFKGTVAAQKYKEKAMKTSKWTPVEIEVFLQIYYRGKPQFANSAPAKQKAVLKLSHCDLIISYDLGQTHRVTDKGRAFLQLLLNTPIPVKQVRWIDSRTNEEVVLNESNNL